MALVVGLITDVIWNARCLIAAALVGGWTAGSGTAPLSRRLDDRDRSVIHSMRATTRTTRRAEPTRIETDRLRSPNVAPR
jgi:hypothetical protein